MLVYALDTKRELKVLKKYLKELCGSELEFVGFTDGRELIAATGERRFDAAYIYLDYNAYDLTNSGLSTAQWLFAKYEYEKLNIIGVSDIKNVEHASVLMKIFSSVYIDKPYDRDKLIETLKHLRFAVEVKDKTNPYIRHI